MRTASGATVPLKAVAEISFGQGPSKVRRYNQNRRFMLAANLNHSELGPALKKVRDLPIFKNLPTGVQIVDVGQAQYMQELFTSFVLAMVAGIMLVFAVLVLLFARVFQPITILGALPLSLGGAVLGLMVTGSPISLATVLGILMLMGLVAKNSILLVEFAIEEMRAGKDRADRAARGRPQARAAHRHDLGGDDRRHAAAGARARGRCVTAGPDGDRGHRRARDLDRIDAGHGAGRVHLDRRLRALAQAQVFDPQRRRR